jgi:hypothetical protein
MPARRARPTDYNLTSTDVAEQLGLARKTVDNWRYLGIGPRWRAVGPNGYPRYCQRDVDAFKAEANGHRHRRHTRTAAEPAKRARK